MKQIQHARASRQNAMAERAGAQASAPKGDAHARSQNGPQYRGAARQIQLSRLKIQVRQYNGGLGHGGFLYIAGATGNRGKSMPCKDSEWPAKKYPPGASWRDSFSRRRT